jgi:protein-disulfide isomerase
MSLSRRTLALALAAFVLLILAAALALRDRSPSLVFEDRADLPGFRNLVLSDPAAGGATALPPSLDQAARTGVPRDVCAALFQDAADPRLGSGAPMVVYFTDYRCPYCREMGKLLIARAEAGEITLIFKEWPILGPQSRTAARAALAASRQGAFLKAHERLKVSTFVPNAAYARDLAGWYGLDPNKLAADFDGPEVAGQLDRIDALAKALGLGGVPGLVVGRTVALRSVDEDRLDALIEAERDLGPPPC